MSENSNEDLDECAEKVRKHLAETLEIPIGFIPEWTSRKFLKDVLAEKAKLEREYREAGLFRLLCTNPECPAAGHCGGECVRNF